MLHTFFKKIWDLPFQSIDKIIPSKREYCLQSLQKRMNKILLICLQFIGDSMIFTPVVSGLRQKYSDARIDMLCNTVSYQIFKNNPAIDNFYVWENTPWVTGRLKGWIEFISIMREIRKNKYDCVVLDVSQSAFRYSLIAYLTGVKIRVGFNREGKGFLNNICPPFDPNVSFLKNNLNLAHALGVEKVVTKTAFYYSKEDKRKIESLLEGRAKKTLIVINPGTKRPSKMWFKERFARLAMELVSRFRAEVIFTGSKKDCTLVEDIISKTRGENIISLAGKTSIGELGALLDKSDLLISVDSGPVHIAAALDCPTVVLMGAQDKGHYWRIENENSIIIRKELECAGCRKWRCWHRKCMEEITVEEVLLAAERLLSRHENRN